MRYSLVFVLLGSASFAETPMTAEEFDRYVTGKTLTFGTLGEDDYGVEQYLPKQRVRWSAFDGQCLKGRWYEEDTNICFIYEDDSGPHCWSVVKTPEGIEARDVASGQVIFEGKDDPSALICGELFSELVLD